MTAEKVVALESNYVIDLRNIGSGDIALVGGKGANLGELVRAGLPVGRRSCPPR